MSFYKKSDIPYHLTHYFVPAEIGLEPTPDDFVEAMVEVFRSIRRVLRDDGTVWLNLGDSYASYRDGKATPDTTRGDSTGTLVALKHGRNAILSELNPEYVEMAHKRIGAGK